MTRLRVLTSIAFMMLLGFSDSWATTKRGSHPGVNQVRIERNQSVPMLAASEIAVANALGSAIQFSLRNRQGTWDVFVINPGYRGIYRNPTAIRVVTQGRPAAEYAVRNGGRYLIYWNASQQRRDVSKQS